MALQVAKGSLFSVLLRSPWWYSALIGLFFIAISVAISEGKYIVLGIASALPFFGIAGFAGRKQSQLPSRKRIQEVAQEARNMPAVQIAEKIANRYKEQNFESETFKGNAADLEITRGYRKLLLSSKRCKVANTGIEPLKQLVAAGEKVEATGYLYVALGEISAAARQYANQNSIELIQADRLAAFFDNQAKIE